MDQIHKKLVEDYEDAQFAMLMDSYALAEGDRLWTENEALLQDPAYAPPEGLEDRMQAAVQKALRKQHARAAARRSGKVLARVAMILMALIAAFSVTFASVEAFRVQVLNMVLDYQETHTNIQFVAEEEGSQVQSSDRLSAYDLLALLPDTYSLESYKSNEYQEVAEIYSSSGLRITWDVLSITASSNIDTENADYVGEVTVQGYDGILVEKNELSYILWGDTNAGWQYFISAPMSHEELLELAEQLYE